MSSFDALVEMKRDQLKIKALLEYKTVSNGPKQPTQQIRQLRSTASKLREGEMRSLVNVVLLDGSKWTKEVIAIKGQPLYTYHNAKKIYLEHDGVVFREVAYERKKDISEESKKTWKLVGGKAVKS